MPVVSQRLTVRPSGVLGDEIRVPILLQEFARYGSSASSQVIRCQLSEPGARYSGY